MGFQSKIIFILPSCKMFDKYTLHIVTMSILVFVVSGCSRFGGGDPVKNMRSVQRQVITRQLPARGIQTIRISENYGSVEIEFNDDKVVTIAATRVIKAKSDMESRRHLIDMDINTNRSGDMMMVATSYPHGFYEKYHGRVNYSVTAPRGMDVDIVADHGTVTVSQGAGDVRVKANSGHVSLFEPGGECKVETKSGDIRFETAAGPVKDIALSTNSGDVTAIVPGDSNAVISANYPQGMGAVSLTLKDLKVTPVSTGGILNQGGHKINVISKNGNVLIAPNTHGKKID